ncbi:unnamed protein product [Amoebophrya sp. A120]|nr:unnamed protein product [Amoebophrya sp. A120]|eukprot:GSA120T00020862001.1
MIEMESSRIGGESSEIERVEKKMSAKNDFFRAQFLDSEVSGTPSTLDQTLNSNSDGARLAREFLDQFGDCGAGNWVGPGPKNSANFEANANSFNTPQPWHQDGMPQGGQYLVLITVNTPDGLDTQKTGTWIGTSDLLSGSEAWISFPENGEQTGDAAAQEAVALSGPMNKCHNRKKIFGSKARPPLIAGDPELDQEAHFQLVGPYEDAKPLSDTGMRGTDTRQGPAAAESYLPVRDVKQKLLKTPSSCDPRMVLVPGPPGTVLIIRNYELAHAGPQMILSGKKEWSYEEVREKCCDQQRRTLLRLNI